MKIKQSVCFPMMEPLPLPLEDFFPQVVEMGFQAIETWKPDASFPSIAQLAQRCGLQIASFTGHDSISDGFNDPTQHDRIIAELRASIDMAAQYQIPGVIVFSGNRRPGQSNADAVDACVSGLQKIAPYAEQKGVNLNMELLNSLVDHPGYQNDHAEWGLSVVKRVNSPRVKLLYDIYHMQIMEGNLIQTIRENIEWIGHFHTAGVPGRADLDDTQEINYTAVCKAIAATDYPLFVGHEFRPRGELFASLKNAFQLCNQG